MLDSSRALIVRFSFALLAVTPLSPALAQRVAPSAVHRLDVTPSGTAGAADTADTRERTRLDVAKRGARIGLFGGAIAGATVGALLLAVDEGTLISTTSDRVYVFTILTAGGALSGALLGAAVGALFGG